MTGALGIVEGLRRGLNYGRQGQRELAAMQIQLSRLAMERRQLEMQEQQEREAAALRKQQQKLNTMQEERLQKAAELAERAQQMKKAEWKMQQQILQAQQQAQQQAWGPAPLTTGQTGALANALPVTPTTPGAQSPVEARNAVGLTQKQMEYLGQYHPDTYARLVALSQPKPQERPTLTDIQGDVLNKLVEQYGPEKGLQAYYQAQQRPETPTEPAAVATMKKRQELLSQFDTNKWTDSDKMAFVAEGQVPTESREDLEALRASLARRFVDAETPEGRQQALDDYRAISYAPTSLKSTDTSKPLSLLDQGRIQEFVQNAASSLFSSLESYGWEPDRAFSVFEAVDVYKPEGMNLATWRKHVWDRLETYSAEPITYHGKVMQKGKPLSKRMKKGAYEFLKFAFTHPVQPEPPGGEKIEPPPRLPTPTVPLLQTSQTPQGLQVPQIPQQTPQTPQVPQANIPSPQLPPPVSPGFTLSDEDLKALARGARGRRPSQLQPVPPATPVEATLPPATAQAARATQTAQRSALPLSLQQLPIEVQDFHAPNKFPTVAAILGTDSRTLTRAEVARIFRAFFADVKTRKMSNKERDRYLEILKRYLSIRAASKPTK